MDIGAQKLCHDVEQVVFLVESTVQELEESRRLDLRNIFQYRYLSIIGCLILAANLFKRLNYTVVVSKSFKEL